MCRIQGAEAKYSQRLERELDKYFSIFQWTFLYNLRIPRTEIALISQTCMQMATKGSSIINITQIIQGKLYANGLQQTVN